jgi:hypothetical protein
MRCCSDLRGNKLRRCGKTEWQFRVAEFLYQALQLEELYDAATLGAAAGRAIGRACRWLGDNALSCYFDYLGTGTGTNKLTIESRATTMCAARCALPLPLRRSRLLHRFCRRVDAAATSAKTPLGRLKLDARRSSSRCPAPILRTQTRTHVTCTHNHARTHAPMRARTHAHLHTHSLTHFTITLTFTLTLTRTHAHIHTRTRTLTHSHKHIHIHTHTRMRVLVLVRTRRF